MAGNANSGRQPKPNHLKVVEGTASKSEFEAAKAVDELLPTCDPGAPDFLTDEARAEWDRVIADAMAIAHVKSIDRAQLAIYCQAWSDWAFARRQIAELGERGFVETTPSGYRQISSWMQVANRAEDRIRAFGDQFRFSPTARAKAGIAAAQPGLFDDPAVAYFR